MNAEAKKFSPLVTFIYDSRDGKFPYGYILETFVNNPDKVPAGWAKLTKEKLDEVRNNLNQKVK